MSINGTGAWSTVTWPWPQVRFLEYYTLGFATITTHLWLYELYCDGNDVWQATAMQDLGLTASITQVDVAESGTFYLVTTFGRPGGVATCDSYIRNPGTEAPLISQLPTAYIPESIAVCNYNGQFLLGGLVPGTYDEFADMTFNTVAWGQIGRMEFRANNLTTYTAGYRNMPWGEKHAGIVYKLKKLGNRVMVYGDGGKAFLIPASSPVSTYGLEVIPGAGIRSGFHADGDDHLHGYIDANYDFWIVDSSFKFAKLGYREFMEDLVTTALTKVSFEPNSRRFYISNGVKGYVLTEHGLYSTHQFVTSVGNYRGLNLCGFIKTGTDSKYRLVSDTLDFRIRGLKTLEGMEVSGDIPSDATMKLAVDYKYKQSEDFSRSTWKTANDRGQAAPIITAPEFRLCVEVDSYEDVVIDYINTSLKVVDKRMIRGLYNKDRSMVN